MVATLPVSENLFFALVQIYGFTYLLCPDGSKSPHKQLLIYFIYSTHKATQPCPLSTTELLLLMEDDSGKANEVLRI